MAEESEPNSTSTAGRGTRILLLVVVPAIVLGGALGIYLHGGRFVETDNAYVKADVVPISAEVSGTISRVHVSANQAVEAGQLLFSIDSEPFAVNVEKARAKLAQVRTELAALQSSYREADARIGLAASNLAFAIRELERQRDLQGRDFVSASALDTLNQQVEVHRREQELVRLDLQRIAASLGGDADRPLEKHPAYRAALADLEEARLQLRRVDVRAPRNGTLSKAPLVGQYIRAGNMITALVCNDQVWVEANLTEKELTHLRIGQVATVELDSYPGRRWHGSVESISPATGAEFSIIPAQNATGNWVKVPQRVPVRIRLESGGDAPPLRAGLSAVVEIDTRHQRKLLGMSF
ncbi:HlyD family secretion protein [Gilvimarinus sp. F26214L]|uniref:HlyD family secretion protein n=1 Tax=Gilvimarinus sp. DZF01 TaxID=3461371 RepID=UPI0040452FF4